MAFKVYVDTGEPVWSTNGLVFDTLETAKVYGNGLWSRWMAVIQFAVIVEVAEGFCEPLSDEQVKRMRVA